MSDFMSYKHNNDLPRPIATPRWTYVYVKHCWPKLMQIRKYVCFDNILTESCFSRNNWKIGESMTTQSLWILFILIFIKP